MSGISQHSLYLTAGWRLKACLREEGCAYSGWPLLLFLQPLTQWGSLLHTELGFMVCVCVCVCVSECVCVSVLSLPPCCAPSASAAITSAESARSYLLIILEPAPSPGQSKSSILLPETALWRLGVKDWQRGRGEAERGETVSVPRLRGREISLLLDDPPKGSKGRGRVRQRD